MPGCRNRKTLFENDVHYHNSKDQLNPNSLKINYIHQMFVVLINKTHSTLLIDIFYIYHIIVNQYYQLCVVMLKFNNIN